MAKSLSALNGCVGLIETMPSNYAIDLREMTVAVAWNSMSVFLKRDHEDGEDWCCASTSSIELEYQASKDSFRGPKEELEELEDF